MTAMRLLGLLAIVAASAAAHPVLPTWLFVPFFLAVVAGVGLVLWQTAVRHGRAAEAARQRSEARFRAIFEHLDVGIALDDYEGHIVEANPALEQILGRSADELVGRHYREWTHPEDLAADRDRFAQLVAGALDSYKIEKRLLRPDGEVRWGRLTVTTAPDHVDGKTLHVALVEDLTTEKRVEERLQRRAAQQAVVARLGQQALEQGGLRELRRAATEAVRDTLEVAACTYEPPETRLVRTSEAHADQGAVVMVPVAAREVVHGVLRVELGPGQHLDPDDRSFLQAVANVLAAAAEQADAQAQLQHQALHDALTGLPNRLLVLDRIRHALQRQQRAEGRVAVLFADLDHFKLVNDGLGHGVGDRVLSVAAQRMQATLRPGDTIARIGGDEFAVVCEVTDGEDDAFVVAERLIDALTTSIVLDGNSLHVSASIGIALGGPDEGAEALLRKADLAMYQAKTLGRGRWALYDDSLQQAASDRLELTNALRHALERDQLRLVYQPEIDLRTGEMPLVEALMRWEHPQRGTVSPAEFIPAAEESGIIGALGEWALREACATAATWDPPVGEPPAVAVNLSPKQLSQPDLCEVVADALRTSGLPAHRLWLEVTEGAVMQDPVEAVTVLQRLKALGVSIAIDDFGTGYSSLAHLKAFPLDALKIDRSFVSGLSDDIQDHSIVAATIELAHALGMLAIAEGVETERQERDLLRLGCDIGQGYRWSRPVAPARLDGLLAALAFTASGPPEPPTSVALASSS